MGPGVSFRSLTVVGIGLVGGSLAAAAKRSGEPPLVRGVDVDQETCSFAMEHGIVDEALSPDQALGEGWFGSDATDLVVLATPARGVVAWLERLADAGYQGVVTDVASTKGAIVETARRYAGGGYSFVGGHPMAGSELSGIAAADPDLFSGAYYVLTPTEDTDMEAYRKIHRFAVSLGARVISIDAAIHDEAVAVVSHIPHVAAAALVQLANRHAGENAEILRLAAGGFKDTTRIAAGSPDLWTGICLDNANAVASGAEELAEELLSFATSVRSGDAGALRAFLEQAAEVRRSLPARWVADADALSELVIPITDRPGMVSAVTTAVGRAGCNIEDIEIDHQSEDTALLRLLLTEEGDREGLMASLEADGFAPRMRRLRG